MERDKSKKSYEVIVLHSMEAGSSAHNVWATIKHAIKPI